jgi:uncharacterized protein YgiM (DUF1202 family)
MKLNWCFFFGAMISTGLLAQTATNTVPPGLPELPAPSAPTPAVAAPSVAAPDTNTAAGLDSPKEKAAKPTGKKAPPKKSTAKKSTTPRKAPAGLDLKTVPLVPGPATVVASNVNVRGQARLAGEVVTRITKGTTVTVIEEIVKNNSGADEPSAWAKIGLPAGTKVWVHSMFVDTTNKVVMPRKLNVRSGPGENYSPIGTMVRGDKVEPLSSKGDWIEIEAPPSAFAFVASQYLKQEPPGAIASTTAPLPVQPSPPAVEPTPAPPVPATVSEGPAVAAAPTNTPPVPSPEPAPALPAPTPSVTAPENPGIPPEPVIEEPPPKRIVMREGIVKGTTSIQAPTQFVLVSDKGVMIDYLYSTSKSLDLRRYKGLRIVVTGEEFLEERWGNTPLIEIHRIDPL